MNQEILNALEYYRLTFPDWVLVPLSGKKPILRDWTALEETPTEAFKGSGITGIGCVLEPSGLAVLDFDPQVVESPDETVAALLTILREHGVNLPLDEEGKPRTLMHLTGSGGIHLFFSSPPRPTVRPLWKSTIGTVELLSRGAQAVLPPSTSPSGGKYRALTDYPPAPLPPLITSGERNTRLTSLGGKLRRHGAEGAELQRSLNELNQALTDEPLPEEEVESICRSLERYPPAEPPESPAGDTDLENARILLRCAPERIRYVEESGWIIWTGKRWARDEKGHRTLAVVNTTLSSHYRERLARAADENEEKRLTRSLRRAESEQAARTARALAAGQLTIQERELDQHGHLLNTPGGIVDLRTGEIAPHDPARLLTRSTSCPPGNGQPIRFLRFLDEVTCGRPELTHYLQRLLGYGITGQKGERVFVILWGTGANGKTALVETLRGVLGDYLLTTRRETFELLRRETGVPTHGLARLAGARLVTAAETREGERLDPGLVKAITGGDTVCARYLYGEYFEFKPDFLPILITNRKPHIPGDDQAIWSRIRLIPFERSFSSAEQIPNLARELVAEEGPGILTWLIRGATEYYHHGLSQVECELVREAGETYRREADPVYEFARERLVRVPGARTTAAEIYRAYSAWCEEEGCQPVPKRTLGRILRNLGFEASRTAQTRLYLNVTLWWSVTTDQQTT